MNAPVLAFCYGPLHEDELFQKHIERLKLGCVPISVRMRHLGICPMVFLWTASGRLEPSEIAGFADMPDNSVFQKAISWAKEEGITSGTSPTTFGPDKPCTRAQIMTFLYHVYQ